MTSPHRRTFLARGAAAAAGLQLANLVDVCRRWAPAQTLPVGADPPDLYTSEAKQAVESGLAFLASRQHDDGAFGSGGYSRNVAVGALCGLAMMAHGDTPGRGRYGGQVARCLDFMLAHTQDSGFIVAEGDANQTPMYGHGFATLFLAEAYGMSNAPTLREKLAKAVKLIVDTQNAEGGWRYQPVRSEADLSVTICQVMALRAARNAGVHVPPETIERCIQYVKQSQNPDGGFMYMLPAGQSEFPRSAAGVVALHSAGIYDGPELTAGMEYLKRFLPTGDAASTGSHFFYGHYYAVQAMWQAGGDAWIRWYPAIRDVLLARQTDTGAWVDAICQEYGTAMACIILQMPVSQLPIFQR